MVVRGTVRTLLAAVVLILAGCGSHQPARPPTAPPPTLPPIVMTSGDGIAPASQTWTIAPDGSWTFKDEVPTPGGGSGYFSGRLTDAQRAELAALAGDPALLTELRTAPGPCSVSDGPQERLQVGSLSYLANFCDEHRPHVDQLRSRIIALTAG